MSSGSIIYKELVSFKIRLDYFLQKDEDVILSSQRKITTSSILLEAYVLSLEISREGEYTDLLEKIEVLKGRLFSCYLTDFRE